MSQMNYAVLELEADADHDGTRETGVFYLVGNLEIQQNIDIDHLIGGIGSNINSIITSRTEASPKRAGYYLDLGGGSHTFKVNFIGWEGAQADLNGDGDAEQFQWGDGSGIWSDASAGGSNGADATGGDPTRQVNLLAEYLRSGEFDSRAKHGKLRWGEYRDGKYHDSAGSAPDDYLHVVILDARLTRSSEAPVRFDGSMTMVEAEDWRDVVDAFGKLQI